MVTFLISALVVFAILGIGLYFWQKPRRQNADYVLPPSPPDARGLFADDTLLDEKPAELADPADDAALLIARAHRADRSALTEASATLDREAYDRVLSELVRQTDSDAKRLALMSFVSQEGLPVNDGLARAMVDLWRKSPNRNMTLKALHFAALSDNAELYCTAVEEVLALWRDGRMPDISPDELRTLFDGEFWILSAHSRSSGAGFVLKQTLADARRELEAAANANR